MTNAAEKRLPYLRLLLLTAAALAIHGYHLGAEDGEIYVPAARKLLHPDLYPFGTEFFTSHGKLSMFSHILAWTAKLTHLSMDWTLFVWYLISLFATLASSWLLVKACFASPTARWTAVTVAAAVLSMPATNTGLLLIDPYLTARSFSTPLTLFALAACLEHRYVRLIVLTLITAAIHPQMAVYLVFLAALIRFTEISKPSALQKTPALAGAGILPTGFQFERATGAYREALYSRDYFFLYSWEWYHWLGMLAPLAILAWFWKGNLRGTLPGFRRLSFALIPFGLLSIAAAAVVSLPAMEMFVRLQPLRSFHLITFVFVLFFAGILGEYLGKNRPWAIGVLCCLLGAGMFIVSRQTYPNSPQIELPAKTSSNPWVNTLLWVRQNTPRNAVFAVDSRYFKDPVVDVHGFRAIAERSELADYYKDGGVVSLFPALADEWKQMSNATYGLNHFREQDFDRLRSQYPVVSWTVVHGPAPQGMDCPYQNQGFAVCKLNNLSQSATSH